ncbi:GntR family transcriptional regulator [Enterococcus nangangensis]
MSTIVDIVRKNLDFTQNKTLKESVYEAFRKTIILGEIPANSRINEKEVASALNISRTPIRYAMNKLAQEKLVEHIPRIGIVVKGIRVKDAYEIYDIRMALDTLATITAMRNMHDEDFQRMENLLKNGDRLNAENKVDEVLQNFSDFNSLIYGKSEMPRLKEIVTNLQTYLVYFRDIAIRSSDRRDLALEEHWLIFRGMKNNNEEQVRLITHEHLERSLKFIVDEMERRKLG